MKINILHLCRVTRKLYFRFKSDLDQWTTHVICTYDLWVMNKAFQALQMLVVTTDPAGTLPFTM